MMVRSAALSRRVALALASGLFLVSSAATAQWQWRDENGRMVISDRAPGPEVPTRSIIKGPGFKPLDPIEARIQVIEAEKKAAARPAPANSVADREKDFQKRQQEAAEAQKKADEAAAQASANAALCSRMRGSLVALQSGRRLIQTDERGEQAVMDDSARQEEINRLQQQIGELCK